MSNLHILDRAKAFYRTRAALIEAGPRDDWALDPYEWDHDGTIVLTPIERWLWHDIRLCDLVLYPQYPVGRFYVDFANPVAKVAIECDGKAFHLDVVKDERRQAEIEALGWTVYRFTGAECRQDTEEVYDEDHDCYVLRPSETRRRIRRIGEDHDIKRFRNRQWRPFATPIAEALSGAVDHIGRDDAAA